MLLLLLLLLGMHFTAHQVFVRDAAGIEAKPRQHVCLSRIRAGQLVRACSLRGAVHLSSSCAHTPPYSYVCVLYVYRHVILRTGLKNMSNTKVGLQAPRQPRWLLTSDTPVCRHTQFMSAGAAYGAGIYLAENMQTSAGYSVQMPAWPKSMFGHNVSVMALCEVHVHTATVSATSQVSTTVCSLGFGLACCSRVR